MGTVLMKARVYIVDADASMAMKLTFAFMSIPWIHMKLVQTRLSSHFTGGCKRFFPPHGELKLVSLDS